MSANAELLQAYALAYLMAAYAANPPKSLWNSHLRDVPPERADMRCLRDWQRGLTRNDRAERAAFCGPQRRVLAAADLYTSRTYERRIGPSTYEGVTGESAISKLGFRSRNSPIKPGQAPARMEP